MHTAASYAHLCPIGMLTRFLLAACDNGNDVDSDADDEDNELAEDGASAVRSSVYVET